MVLFLYHDMSRLTSSSVSFIRVCCLKWSPDGYRNVFVIIVVLAYQIVQSVGQTLNVKDQSSIFIKKSNL